MSEYWLISAPGDKTCQQTFDTMNNLTSKQHNLCNNYKFQIPDLKVGTLDQLVGLSDDLGKLDTYVEQITRKVAAYLGEVLEDQRDKLHENLLANNCPDPPADNASKLSYATKTSKNFLNNDDSTTPNINGSAKLNAEGQCTPSSNKMKCLNHPCCYLSPNNCKYDRSHEHFTTSTSSIVKFDEQCDSGADDNLEASEDEHFASFSSSAKLLNRIVDSNKVHRINQNSTNTTTTTLCSLGSISGSCNSAQFSEMNKIFNQQIHQKSPHTIKKQKTQQQQQQNTFNNEHETKFSKVCRNSLGQKEIERTIEWWLRKEKKYTKKRRSTPVSSCCGGNGRSSPNNDINVAPGLPTSPHPADLSAYITRFQWDMAKYPIKQSLRNIADIISKQVGQIDGDLKTKATAYNNLKGNLQNLEKKQTGSLLTRNLADLVKKEHFILDSEYLTTLLVIVPKMMANDWLTNYEKITDMIVPRSSTLINQDNDYCLFNVTLFKKVVDEFKLHAREKKFIVRDFEYNEEELAAGKNEITKLITDKKKQFGPLVRWLKVNFSEAFCALIHVKALRVFVESVLRYGLPVNFQAILIEPYKKNVKRLREILNQLYGHLDGSSAGAQASGLDNVEIPGLGFGQADYFPYVFYKINIDMIDTKA